MEPIDYKDKVILAPMVRCCTLAFRLLALEYGADLVYSEYKLTNTIDYFLGGAQKPIFQTCEKERGKVVFQLGTNNPARALKAAKLLEKDVAAIDINMGCPKEFSVGGGMGAALLKKPDLVKEILTTLVQNVSIPITCKIRCLPTIEETITFCKMVESCGVKSIAVHGRFQNERSSQPNHNDFIKEIAQSLTIPVIANGGSNEIKTYEDIAAFKASCGVSSVMLARVAMWNCSIFRPEGMLPLDTVLRRFLEISLETNNFFYNTKYCVQQMLHTELTSERGVAVLSSLGDDEIYKLFSMLNEYNESQKKAAEFYKTENLQMNKRRMERSDESNLGVEDENYKKFKSSCDEKNVICMHVRYLRKDFREGTLSPKSILHTYSMDNKLPKPIYRTEEKLPERAFKSVLEFNGVFYTTPHWDVNKQFTEQSAALAALETLGINYKSKNGLLKNKK